MSEAFYASSTVIIGAFLLDLIAGEPGRFPHPVVLIGRVVAWVDRLANRDYISAKMKRIAGGGLAILMPLFIFFLTAVLISTTYRIMGDIGGAAFTIILAYTTISPKGLRDAALHIRGHLRDGDLEGARKALSQIVGRSTEALEEREIVRGTVESVAENTSDGVTAPLFYLGIGGVPLAMAYKAINTMDSMIGYKNERYVDFGRASARLDDMVNYIPARLTGLLMVASSLIMNMNWRGAWKVMLRDGRNHPSPNAGYPEAAAAGAMNIQLGGENRYPGRVDVRPYIGDKVKELEIGEIDGVVMLMYLSSAIMLFAALSLRALII